MTATTTTQPAQFTPAWLVAQLQDLIADAPDYVSKGAARLLDSFTTDLAQAEAANPQVDASDDDDHREEEDEPL